ncbi:predicted protein [Chaetoceros tenuissimus]|uniref:Uncharacterized protein n=1 Tax=Chaetoceros tenuissimus TaxID=426638 RepID=A0AAD3CHC4_9STRA|nr:predicted protein [Chaetoceros tenuissimus]
MMFFQESSEKSEPEKSRDLVLEAIKNAQNDFLDAVEKRENPSSPESKKKCLHSKEVKTETPSNDDDLYRNWNMQPHSPSIPFDKWASRFPMLRLLDDPDEHTQEDIVSKKKEFPDESKDMKKLKVCVVAKVVEYLSS